MKRIFIAELGINAHGDFQKMLRMCKKAQECGATYVKGQYYNPHKILGKAHPALQEALESQFSRQQHEQIAAYCRTIDIHYGVSIFTPYDLGWLDGFSVFHKVASRMNKNQEFLAKIEQCKKITFMSVQPEMGTKVPERFKLMWCIREYPTVKGDILKYPYGPNFGLSSHCPDPSATKYAIEHGAIVLENHLCESREENGCDIPSSLTFEEYATLIKEVSSMGSGDAVSRIEVPKLRKK